mgnify:CR=1 FL=1
MVWKSAFVQESLHMALRQAQENPEIWLLIPMHQLQHSGMSMVII